MKKLLLTLLCVCFLVKLNASHLAGAAISYKVINDTTRTYKIFLEITRECNGISLSNTATVNVYCGANCSSQLVNLTLNRDSIKIKSQVCNLNLTSCNGGSLPGFEVHYYSIQTNLPICASKLYTFTWLSGGRNPGIVNLSNPSSQNFSVYSYHRFNYLPNQDYSKNAAPSFLSSPSPFFYAGSKVCYGINAIDTTDNDSLAYELVPCSGNNAVGMCKDTLQYNPGFTYNKPFGNFPHTFDPVTGVLSFVPPSSSTGLYNFAVKVKEYRKGFLIAEHIRDLVCAIIPPTAGNVNISCDPIAISSNPAITIISNQGMVIPCNTFFSFDLVFPIGGSGTSPGFQIDYSNSNIPAWVNVVVDTTTGLKLVFTGMDSCVGNVSASFSIKLIQKCVPGVIIPSTSYIALNLFKTGALSIRNSNFIASTNNLIISPNPTKDFLQLELSNNQKIKTIQVLDISGKLISEIIDLKNSTTNLLVTSHLKNSVYYLKVMTDQSIYYSKFIKE